MRGLLVVNPQATATTARVRDVLVHALADLIDLDVVPTDHAGHARELAAAARRDGWDVVVTFGGDGTINEVVNGLLADGPGPDVPALATVPGGSGNVFARALGLPADPVEATGQLLDAVRDKRIRHIGLGRANGQWFTINAGFGVDAEVIAAMEQLRREGHQATPARYLATAVRQMLFRTDRREPALSLHRPGVPPVEGIFAAFVQNTTPWTYFGAVPIEPCPRASFDTGLDVFALRSLGLAAIARYARRMVTASPAGSTRQGLAVLHDQTGFEVRATRDVAYQIDGDAHGPTRSVRFESMPAALRTFV